jgi:hypothetical protein
MRNSGFFTLLITILVLNACSKSNQPNSSVNYEDLARQKYGMAEDYTCIENASKKLVLCKHMISDPDISLKSWDYFVYEVENEKIIFENTVDKGNVKWYSETEIEISKTPGTMTSDETMQDYAWIINILDGKKIKKSEYLKKERF